jgi:hypothetical protein
MNEQSLPQNFEGFSTAELLKMWAAIPIPAKWDPQDPPPGKVLAMRRILEKFKLTPNDWGDGEELKADIAQSKKLLAPYGIDPAPWADQEGNRQPELEAAWHKKLEQGGASQEDETAST